MGENVGVGGRKCLRYRKPEPQYDRKVSEQGPRTCVFPIIGSPQILTSMPQSPVPLNVTVVVTLRGSRITNRDRLLGMPAGEFPD